MDARAAPAPVTVSVIVPVWNVEPWLRECLDSVVGQTIGLDRLELIAVDDGSTDGSGRILDEYAARYARVTAIHEPNSGGPGRPRNVGLDHASGRYVFFLDADDYLGVEALERLVAMAERNESDIVLGKQVGVDGRRVYLDETTFRRNADRIDLDVAYRSGNVLKLLRRSLIERIGVRFPEGIPAGEDGDFMARLYFEATTISVVADYECYYVRRRPGSQTTRKDRRDDLAARIVGLERDRMMVVAARRKPGAGRDALMRKHIRKLVRMLGGRWRSLEPDERRRVFEVGAAVVRRWHTDRIQRELPAPLAIRAHCLQHGLLGELEDIVACPRRVAFRDPLVERDRIYARYPHFRDGSGIPDSCFDITDQVVARSRLKRAVVAGGRLELAGDAYLSLMGGTTTIELRRWPRGATWRFVADALPTPDLRDSWGSYPTAGFDAAIDLETGAGGQPVPTGTWSIWLSVGTEKVHRAAPLRAPRHTVRGKGVVVTRGETARIALHQTPVRELRLRIGHRPRAASWLEQGEFAYLRVRRRLGMGMPLRAGWRLARAIRRVNPGLAARLVDD